MTTHTWKPLQGKARVSAESVTVNWTSLAFWDLGENERTVFHFYGSETSFHVTPSSETVVVREKNNTQDKWSKIGAVIVIIGLS